MSKRVVIVGGVAAGMKQQRACADLMQKQRLLCWNADRS